MSLMDDETRQIPAVADRLLRDSEAPYAALAKALRSTPPSCVSLIGRGSSGQAAWYGAYVIEVLTGTLCAMPAPSTVTMHGARFAATGTWALAVSQSGRSRDLLALLSALKDGGAQTVAIVNDERSPLADLAHEVLPQLAGPENAVAATKTLVASLIALARLAAEWSGDQSIKAALERLPERLEAALACDWSAVIPRLIDRDRLFVIGRGAALGVVGEIALKLKETCGIQAEAFSAAEVLHGPRAIVDRGFPVIGVAPAGPDQVSTLDTLGRLADSGADIVAIGTGIRGGAAMPLPAPLHPLLDPIVALTAFYPVAAQLSLARGLSPDRPRNLTKVTDTV